MQSPRSFKPTTPANYAGSTPSFPTHPVEINSTWQRYLSFACTVFISSAASSGGGVRAHLLSIRGHVQDGSGSHPHGRRRQGPECKQQPQRWRHQPLGPVTIYTRCFLLCMVFVFCFRFAKRAFQGCGLHWVHMALFFFVALNVRETGFIWPVSKPPLAFHFLDAAWPSTCQRLWCSRGVVWPCCPAARAGCSPSPPKPVVPKPQDAIAGPKP